MITIHRPFNRRDQFAGDTDENTPRKVIFHTSSYNHSIDGLKGKAIAEKLFHIFNAPEEMLNEYEQVLVGDFRKDGNYSLSVGDVVQVDDTYYLCESFGWKEYTK